MPNWSHNVPDDPRGQGLPLIRTPAARSLTAIVTSTDLIGCDTHFWGGHTVPCDKPTCDACNNGIAYRWHAYLSAYNPKDQLHFIFECTAQAAQSFIRFRKEFNALRGCLFEAYRWKHARNGRVIIKCVPGGLPVVALPEPPDLARVMAIIWRLPIPQVFVAGAMRGVSRVHADLSGNGDSTDPRDYDHPQP